MQSGGAGYPAPTPVRKSGGTGCWVWGLVGCGALLIALVIAAVVGTFAVMRSSKGKGLVNTISSATKCPQQLGMVREALDDYRSDHAGKYPPALHDLIPRYLSDDSALHCGESGEEAVYTPPKPDSPPDAVVISIFTGEMSFVPQQRSRMYVRLLRDGSIVTDQVQRTIDQSATEQVIVPAARHHAGT